MITTTLMGGLGNQLFQMSQTIAHSLRFNLEYCIPMGVENPHYISHPNLEKQKPYIFPGVKYCDKEVIFPNYIEKSFQYEEIGFMNNIRFLGYWQSWKYSQDFKQEILKAFGFDNIETKQGVCSLHYRSTDYKKYPTIHPIITLDYIKNALTKMYFAGYSKFMVFSDDIPEIKSMLSSVPMFGNSSFEYAEGNDELTDLKLMASCGSNITANSTFSLWAAYINPNPEKIVISPRTWFGSDLPHDTKDLYLPNSIIL